MKNSQNSIKKKRKKENQLKMGKGFEEIFYWRRHAGGKYTHEKYSENLLNRWTTEWINEWMRFGLPEDISYLTL